VVRLVWLLASRRIAIARKKYKPEEIVAKLQQVDGLTLTGDADRGCDPADLST
jgi:hypothetical protein